jgi:DNA-binding MarR family transcriptional regulator
VRRFNRFYTQHLGVLQGSWLDSPFSLTQARVLYEIKARGRATATDIGRDLGLDAGYLSRILRGFHKAGLIRKQVSPDDGRQTFLSITARGRQAFRRLETRTERQVGSVLRRLKPPEQERLVSAMHDRAHGRPLARRAARHRAACAEARRPRLGRDAARRNLRAGIQLDSPVRGRVRADRR